MRISLVNFADTALSRGEMKRIAGGSCYAQAKGGGVVRSWGVSDSKSYAIAYAKANGTHWCCDSCSSASWMHG